MPRPQYRRFGFVDFDAMASLPSSDDADQFVCRRANGDNVLVTRADIVAGAGVVPDPLLLGDGAVDAPTYSFLSAPTTGAFLSAIGEYVLTVNGIEAARTREVGALTTQVLVSSGTEAAPALSWIGDASSGFRLVGGGQVHYSALGSDTWAFTAVAMGGSVAGRPTLRNELASNTNPVFLTNNSDAGSGLGGTIGQVSLIANNVEGARFTEAAGTVQVQISDGTEAAPSLSWLGEPGTGFRRIGGGTVNFVALGSDTWQLNAIVMGAITVGAPVFFNEISSNTNPVVIPNNLDPTAGLGGISGQPSLIAGNLSCISVSESGGARQIGFYDGSPIPLQTGVAVTTSAVHAALVNLRLITA